MIRKYHNHTLQTNPGQCEEEPQDTNGHKTSGIWLLRVSEYSDIRGSEYKIEYEYSSLPKSLDRDLFFFFLFFLPFLLLKQEVFHKMVH